MIQPNPILSEIQPSRPLIPPPLQHTQSLIPPPLALLSPQETIAPPSSGHDTASPTSTTPRDSVSSSPHGSRSQFDSTDFDDHFSTVNLNANSHANNGNSSPNKSTEIWTLHNIPKEVWELAESLRQEKKVRE